MNFSSKSFIASAVSVPSYTPVTEGLTGKNPEALTLSLTCVSSLHTKSINVFAASILPASPLSKIPYPQIPPQSSVTPSSLGNNIGIISSPAFVFPAGPLSEFVCCDAFQQSDIAKVPFLNNVISSPPAIEGSKFKPA